MKKLILGMIATLVIALGATAQTTGNNGKKHGKQKPTSEQKATRIANTLALDDKTTAEFNSIYVQWLADKKALKQQYFPDGKKNRQTPQTEAETEQELQQDFKLKKAVLNLREEYYEKFRKVLTAKQVKRMYEIEKHKAGEVKKAMIQRQGR